MTKTYHKSITKSKSRQEHNKGSKPAQILPCPPKFLKETLAGKAKFGRVKECG